MAKSNALKMKLPSVDDLFSTEESRQEAKLAKIYDIPISEIDDFPDHPYRVLDDEDMQALMDSISDRGVITPAMVRKKDDGRYEMISGHRRKRACERLGLETIRCEIVEVTRDEAIILMVDSNSQRSEIPPCDKGKAYKMKLDAIRRQQGERTDLTSAPVVQKLAEIDYKPKTLEIPKLHSDIQRVKRYLMGRGIDERVIDYCHKEETLFEDEAYHNCVFIGKDENGIPKYGALRSTVSNFKRDLDGSDKRFSFKICPNEKADTLHVFEAVIDLMSYITLAVKARSEWYNDNFLSLGGVYATDNKQDVPLALNAYLEGHPNLRTVYLHFDNDEIGRKATKQIKEALQDRYTVIDEPPKSGKDYNDYLQYEIRKRKEPER